MKSGFYYIPKLLRNAVQLQSNTANRLNAFKNQSTVSTTKTKGVR